MDSFTPDVALIDINMPGMGGREAPTTQAETAPLPQGLVTPATHSQVIIVPGYFDWSRIANADFVQ